MIEYAKEELEILEQYIEYHRLRIRRDPNLVSEQGNTIIKFCKENSFYSILDYGCGKAQLAQYIRKMIPYIDIQGYDPGYAPYSKIKDKEYNLVTCIDVMEHILPNYVSVTLERIKSYSQTCFFAISTILARKKLSSGINAHTSVFPEERWLEILKEKFEVVECLGDANSYWSAQEIGLASLFKTF